MLHLLNPFASDLPAPAPAPAVVPAAIYQHPRHEHALAYYPHSQAVYPASSGQSEYTCSVCQLRYRNSVIYHCRRCKWQACQACMCQVPAGRSLIAISLPQQHPHPLLYYPQSCYAGGRYQCNTCRRLVISGADYHCSGCQYDMCLQCVQRYSPPPAPPAPAPQAVPPPSPMLTQAISAAYTPPQHHRPSVSQPSPSAPPAEYPTAQAIQSHANGPNSDVNISTLHQHTLIYHQRTGLSIISKPWFCNNCKLPGLPTTPYYTCKLCKINVCTDCVTKQQQKGEQQQQQQQQQQSSSQEGQPSHRRNGSYPGLMAQSIQQQQPSNPPAYAPQSQQREGNDAEIQSCVDALKNLGFAESQCVNVAQETNGNLTRSVEILSMSRSQPSFPRQSSHDDWVHILDPSQASNGALISERTSQPYASVQPTQISPETEKKQCVESLLSMGFEPEAAQSAAEKASYDLSRAVELLTASSSSSSSSSSSRVEEKSNVAEPANGAEGDNECVVCMSNPKVACLVPCGHIALCMSCADELKSHQKPCPICRQSISMVVQPYRV